MVEKAGLIVILASGGLYWAGEYFSIPRLGTAGLMLFGLWIVAWGVEVAIKGEVTLVNRNRGRHEFFSGIPARLWSAIFMTAGIGILFLGWLEFSTPGGSESFLERTLRSPAGWGTVLGIVGMVVAATGVIRILSGSATLFERPGSWREFGYRASGFVRTFIGLGLIFLAGGLLVAPGWVKSLFDGLVDILKNWLFRL